ncbi:GntR family transcriptional regulator [Streptomyces ureilyticus]|uniref:GntR family transcriptional regulator n=1 Tax=Streptomyces ureilyticus TaxID=1775131 RepID=A0ABX0DRE8_9ACTN|nr:GntR family transcriptional regulator [Streptomyces ureilyticus]NGO43334.1 GntR family transcriptional regulator [Streptomyces ureilyticus]
MATSQSDENKGRQFRRVANALRDMLTGGALREGDPLPRQRDLAAEYGVSRDTVQRVLKELAEEGWIIARQGSGTFVRERPEGQMPAPRPGPRKGVLLGELIREAFARPEVVLDVYSLTSETLARHIQTQADHISAGKAKAPERVAIRMLLPTLEPPPRYPCVKGDPADTRLTDRWWQMSQTHEDGVRTTLDDLVRDWGMREARVQVRRTPLTPEFKLYVVNGSEVLFAPYEVVERPVHLRDGSVVTGLDVLGWSTTFTYFREDKSNTESNDSLFVSSMRGFFESHWNLMAQEASDTTADRPAADPKGPSQ